MKILIMGLPGSGKTTLSKNLSLILEKNNIRNSWYNADHIRKLLDDWDFSPEGRMRQASRMRQYAETDSQDGKIVICDFVCPTEQTRQVFNKDKRADLIIWMDTIQEGRFSDTNQTFQQPIDYDLRIRSFNDNWATKIFDVITNKIQLTKWDNQKPTVQMLGRFQPWHDGHSALFKCALEKTNQVCIMIRDCQNWNDSNPFSFNDVEQNIHNALEIDYYGKYQVIKVPNIVEIVYGRDVGYKINKIELPEEIQKISATDIRRDMGLK
jgi:energy-coupling factor transporter ATP-binding protein EcfA2